MSHSLPQVIWRLFNSTIILYTIPPPPNMSDAPFMFCLKAEGLYGHKILT